MNNNHLCPLCKNQELIKSIVRNNNILLHCPVFVSAPFEPFQMYGRDVMNGKQYRSDHSLRDISHFSFFINPNKNYFSHTVFMNNYVFRRTFVEENEYSNKFPNHIKGEIVSLSKFYIEQNYIETYMLSNSFYPDWFSVEQDFLEKKFNKIVMLS